MSVCNKELKIDFIKYEDELVCFCPLGGSYYTNQLLIEFQPIRSIPDYIKLKEQIDTMIGQELIIEEVVAKVLEVIKSYEPFHARVTSVVVDANHPKVTVSKEYMIHLGDPVPSEPTQDGE